jgi:hypothetical protein
MIVSNCPDTQKRAEVVRWSENTSYKEESCEAGLERGSHVCPPHITGPACLPTRKPSSV